MSNANRPGGQPAENGIAYQVLDSKDDVWLKRHWADGSGNLYDGKYAVEWPWTWVGFADF